MRIWLKELGIQLNGLWGKIEMEDDFKTPLMAFSTVIGCVNNCSYCPQKTLIHNYFKRTDVKKMSFGNFKIILAKLPRNVRVDFSGMAEPFLNKDCAKMIEYTNDKGFQMILCTTLIGMRNEDYERICDIPFGLTYIHLPDNDGNTNMKVDGDYLRILDRVAKNPLKNCTFTYYGSLHKKIIPILKKNNITALKFPLYNRAGNVSHIKSKIKSRGKLVLCKNSKYLNHNDVYPDGSVGFCNADYGQRHTLGNLLTASYTSLFKGEEFKRIRKAFKNGAKGTLCYDCDGCIGVYSKENLINNTKKIVRKTGLTKYIKRVMTSFGIKIK